jgi:alpha-glucosidase (family GH31 glycosyl hydrolase)
MQCTQQPKQRINCYPNEPNFPNATEEACLAQGCCWKALNNDGIPCAFDAVDAPSSIRCHTVPHASRLPCRNPRYFPTAEDQDTCHAMGCCFDDERAECFQPHFDGYELLTLEETSNGWRGTLMLPRYVTGPFKNDIRLLLLHVIKETTDRVRVRIIDPAFLRYEAANVLYPNSMRPKENIEANYKVYFTKKPFGIAVTRRETGQVLFNSTPVIEDERTFNGLIFENQFLEISTQLEQCNMESEPILYGLGERLAGLRLNADLKGDHYPMFTRDQSTVEPHSREGGDNIYGVHPFYMQISCNGWAHGVYMLNSNAMEVVTQKHALTYRLTGGVIDFFVFTGPSPLEVVSQYTELIGRPELPPYWALGYHLGQWGYKSLEDIVDVVRRMRVMGIPQESVWHDIDYMNKGKTFTLDEKYFPLKEMQKLIEDLHFNGQRYISIQLPVVKGNISAKDTMSGVRQIDLNVYNEQSGTNVPPSDQIDNMRFISDEMGTDVQVEGEEKQRQQEEEKEKKRGEKEKKKKQQQEQDPILVGLDMNVFIKGTRGEDTAEKMVFNDWAAYVDFFHPNASSFAKYELGKLYDLLPFDGVWLDMNEPSSTCDLAFASPNDSCYETAEDHPEVVAETAVAVDLSSQFIRSPDIAYPFDPYRQPFVPGQSTFSRGGHGNLNSATVPMGSLHHISLHYNVHSLYGDAHMRVIREALNHIIERRSLLLSRSTFAGSGQFGGHWLGTNAATWDMMRLNIAGVIHMNMFGIPFTGPNICGDNHITSEYSKELCIRWHQAASFFPLYRNHAGKNAPAQSPVDFDDETANILRDVILNRYRYLPYLYTQMYKAHVKGLMVIRPLAFEYPTDDNARLIEDQYMVGDALMVSPVLNKNAIAREVYFPEEDWYDLPTGKIIDGNLPRYVNLPTPLNSVPIHIRGGKIVASQRPGLTTAISRKNPLILVVALARHVSNDTVLHKASGELFIDDGDSLSSVKEGRFSTFEFGAIQNDTSGLNLKSKCNFRGYEGPEMKLEIEQVRIYGVGNRFTPNSSVEAVGLVKEHAHDVKADYFGISNVLVLSQLNWPIGEEFELRVKATPSAAKDTEHGDQREHGEDHAQQEGGGEEKGGQDQMTKKKRTYSMLAIIGISVAAVFLVGLLVVFLLQWRNRRAYDTIA